MNRKALPLGLMGFVLAAGGGITYSLRPDLLWPVTIAELLALSCLMIFFSMHFEAVKAFSGRRSTRMGLHSILTVLLLSAIVIIVNFLASRHSVRWDLSENQNFTLAPQTYRILRTLPHEVKITVFTREKDPGYQAFKERLESYRHASPKLTVAFIDPEKQPKIAQDYGIYRTDTAIFESNGQTIRVTSPSEVELTGALLRISKDQKKRIVFVEGHLEHNLEDRERNGLSAAKEALMKQGYEVAAVSLLHEPAVPTGTSVLVLAGPRRFVTQEEQDSIREYVEKGGRLLILVDPEMQTGLDPLLAQWGLGLGPGVLVDLHDRLAAGDLTALLVRTFTEHEITQDLTSPVLFPSSRHITFDEQVGQDWEYVPLARTSANSWAETHMQGRVVSLNEKEDIKGPLPLAVALVPKKAPKEGTSRPAIVVIGNSTFATNAFFNFPGNSDFFLHTASWLADDRDFISIAPKEPALRPFTPNPTQDRALLYIHVIFLPFVTFLTGIIVWRKRRRL